MCTKINQSMESCGVTLSKDLDNKLVINNNSTDLDIMSPSEEEIMRCLRSSKARMERMGSFDSALGMDNESIESLQQPATKGRRLTLTITDLPLRPALLPIAEPNNLLDSPTTELHLAQVPVPIVSSRLLLEENVVEIPEDRFVSNSRRQSTQSCLSDYQGSDGGGVRFVRTPSVVVSDYSDDTTMCGISQEELEYFRAQRLRRRFSMDTSSSKKDDSASDVSASSSCSNLYYCESKVNTPETADSYVNKPHSTAADNTIAESST